MTSTLGKALLLSRAATYSLVAAIPMACGEGMSPESRDVTLAMVSGDNQSAEVASVLPAPLVVRVADKLGSPLRGVVVRFEGGGERVTSAPSDLNGLASVRWTLARSADVHIVRATVSHPNELSAVEFRATAVPGAPFQISGPNSSALYGHSDSELDTVRIVIRDRFDNPTPFVAVNWTVTAGNGTVRAIGLTPDAGGIARAIWTLGEAEGAQTLTVSTGAVTLALAASVASPLVAQAVVTGFDHGCALVEGGSAYCWGANHFGQLGIGMNDEGDHAIPLAVGGSLSFQQLVAGAAHTCGLTVTGATYCWGGNYGGQLGSATTQSVALPALVPGAPQFARLTAGAYHTCGLTRGGEVFCWGDNSVGQVGDGSQRFSPLGLGLGSHPVPTRVVGDITFSSISASLYATCGLSTNGEIYCWGENSLLTLGKEIDGRCGTLYEDYPDIRVEGDTPCSTSPVRVAINGAAASLTGSGWGMCAILTTRSLQCWGFGVPPSVVPNVLVDNAWVIWHNVCGIETRGALTCWRLPRPFIPQRPFGDKLELVNLATSGRVTCGLTQGASGKVYCWGSNYHGALGDGTTRHRERPAPVVRPFGSGSR